MEILVRPGDLLVQFIHNSFVPLNMIPMDYSIIADKNDSDDSILIYNMKLTEELVEKLIKGQRDLNNLKGIEFCISDDGKGNEKLKIGSEVFHFMKVKETQPVHLLLPDKASSGKMTLIGSVTHKLNPKLELEASKAEAIRQRGVEAEKERLSRKTVELDSNAKINGNLGHKKLIKRNSISKNTTTVLSTNKPTSSSSNYPLRMRVLQLLAIEAISMEDLMKKLSISNPHELKEVISELCGRNFSVKSLILKQEFYCEVKVADWPFYSLRERSQVSRKLSESSFTPINSVSTITTTPPETPETPSPKKQSFSSNFPNRSSIPCSAKKGGASSSVKDRLSAKIKKRR